MRRRAAPHGPHGGAQVEDLEDCRERVSRIILTSWEGPAPSDSAWTAWFGAGSMAPGGPGPPYPAPASLAQKAGCQLIASM